MRQIEGDNVSAIDVAHYLEVLKGNIMMRQSEFYLDPQTKSEKEKLIATHNYDQATICDVFQKFYGV